MVDALSLFKNFLTTSRPNNTKHSYTGDKSQH